MPDGFAPNGIAMAETGFARGRRRAANARRITTSRIQSRHLKEK
jgi:hypothetical protein